MRELLLVAVGGAAGSVARVVASGLAYRLASPWFPWGTFSVNVLGSCLFGVFVGMGVARGGLSPDTRAFLLSGLLGGFTTFSAFSFETVELIGNGFPGRAIVNVVLQVLLGTLALWAGMHVFGKGV